MSEQYKAFAALEGHAILVHGGGKLATQLANQLGVKQQMWTFVLTQDVD